MWWGSALRCIELIASFTIVMKNIVINFWNVKFALTVNFNRVNFQSKQLRLSVFFIYHAKNKRKCILFINLNSSRWILMPNFNKKYWHMWNMRVYLAEANFFDVHNISLKADLKTSDKFQMKIALNFIETFNNIFEVKQTKFHNFTVNPCKP